jgi:hypothetical protein
MRTAYQERMSRLLFITALRAEQSERRRAFQGTLDEFKNTSTEIAISWYIKSLEVAYAMCYGNSFYDPA